MLAKRIIPCLDVTAGRVVKGVNFVELRDAGDPVEVARRYNEQGADELTFLDITASSDDRDIILDVIEAVAGQVFIPLTVGGGVRAVADIRRLLNAGADKISINTAGVNNPDLIGEAAVLYGSQCIVTAVDARRRDKTILQRAGRFIRTAEERQRAWMPFNGLSAWLNSVPAKFFSHRWTQTAPRQGLTWNSPALWPTPFRCR